MQRHSECLASRKRSYRNFKFIPIMVNLHSLFPHSLAHVNHSSFVSMSSFIQLLLVLDTCRSDIRWDCDLGVSLSRVSALVLAIMEGVLQFHLRYLLHQRYFCQKVALFQTTYRWLYIAACTYVNGAFR